MLIRREFCTGELKIVAYLPECIGILKILELSELLFRGGFPYMVNGSFSATNLKGRMTEAGY